MLINMNQIKSFLIAYYDISKLIIFLRIMCATAKHMFCGIVEEQIVIIVGCS